MVQLAHPSKKAVAPHPSTLAWKIPWMEEPGGLHSMGSRRVGHDWATSFSLFTFMHWRSKWQLTPVSLPGESQGWRSLVGCHLWGCTVRHDWSDLAAAAAHPYMTAGKTIALTRQTYVSKVMSLLFNMLSSLVIAFFPRSKRFLISWLQSPSAMILEPKKIKSVTVCIVSPPICHEVIGPRAMIFVFWMLSFKPAFSLSSLKQMLLNA